MEKFAWSHYTEEQPLEITVDLLRNWEVASFRKVAPIQARQLTEEDYQERAGVLHTLEGVETFSPGDYLAVGIKGEEWPLLKDDLERHYTLVGDAMRDGFSLYHPLATVRQACQVLCPFVIKRFNGDVYHGKLGDYVIYSSIDHLHIVDREIFERSYVRV